MTQLENVSDEFLEWLEQCPVQWYLIEQDKDTVKYSFDKEAD